MKFESHELDPTSVANMIGDLYGSLGDDATELLADHLPSMQEAQDYVSELASYALAQAQENVTLKQKIADLKEANATMMMERIRRDPEKPAEEKSLDDLDEAIENIEL